MNNLHEDAQVSHSLINFLFAAAQGAQIFHRLLKEFNHPNFREDILALTERTITRTQRWSEELVAGVPLISLSWTTLESFEAQTAFDTLEKIKQEIRFMLASLEGIVRKNTIREKRENAVLIACALTRVAFSRDVFIRGHLQFAMAFQQAEMAQSADAMLESSKSFAELAEKIVSGLRASEEPDEETLQLLDENLSGLLPTFFTQLHELNLLLAIFSKELSFEEVDIKKDEAKRWISLNISPRIAGYWRAHDMGAEEASAWIQALIPDASQAYQWREGGFSPAEAVQWVENNIPLFVAQRWKDAFVPTNRALAYIQKGIADPDEV